MEKMNNMIKLKNLLNETFHKGDGWFVHEGSQTISTTFENGKQLSFELTFRNKKGEAKNKWRQQAASKWKAIANEIYRNPDLNEIGNPILKSWCDCFLSALEREEMKPFIKPTDRSPVF